MKKIVAILAFSAALLTSCSKFQVENTASVNLAGNWICTIYYSDGTDWQLYDDAEFLTFNTSENKPTELWIDDQTGFWKTFCKVDADNGAYTFGKSGKEYLDNYKDVGQMIWGGKVTPKGAVAPGSGSVTDKIEFFIAFANDDFDGDPTTSDPDNDPYCCAYYIVGYMRTGYPEDNDQPKVDWDLPAVVEVPAITEALPTP